MEDLILKLLSMLLYSLGSVAIGYLIAFLRKHKIVKTMQAHKDLVATGVKAVQQAYESLSGAAKFRKAEEWIVKMANAKGLKINSDEIEILIEAVVKELKMEFTSEWYKNK